MTKTQLTVRSDFLPLLREMVEAWRGLCAVLPALPSFYVVLDADTTISEILWMAERRSGAAPRTVMAELIAAGAVIPVAPPNLVEEVERHLPMVANQQGVDASDAWAVWREYRLRVTILDTLPSRVAENAPDSADLPYVELQNQIGAAGISTRNARHIEPVGGRVVDAKALLTLRTYARVLTVELTVTFAGAHVTLLGLEGLRAFSRLIKWAVDRVRSLPPIVQIALAGAVLLAVASPATRRKLDEWIRTTMRAALLLWKEVAPLIESLLEQYVQATASRPTLEAAVYGTFPAPQTLTARTYAIRALHHGRPGAD